MEAAHKVREKVISPYLYVLKRTRYLMPKNTKISLYYAHVHSNLSYMSALWGYANSTELRKLQVIQNKAVRSIFWQEYRQGMVSTASIIKSNKLLNMNGIISSDSLTIIT